MLQLHVGVKSVTSTGQAALGLTPLEPQPRKLLRDSQHTPSSPFHNPGEGVYQALTSISLRAQQSCSPDSGLRRLIHPNSQPEPHQRELVIRQTQKGNFCFLERTTFFNISVLKSGRMAEKMILLKGTKAQGCSEAGHGKFRARVLGGTQEQHPSC